MNINKLARYLFSLFTILFLCMSDVYANVIVSEEGECYAQNLPQAGLPAVFPNILKFTWKTATQGDKTKIQLSINDDKIIKEFISDKNNNLPNNPLYDSDGQFIGISGQEFMLDKNNYISYRIGIKRNLKKDSVQQDNDYFKFTFGVFEKKDGKIVERGGSEFYNSQDSSCLIKTKYNLLPESERYYPSLIAFHDHALQYSAGTPEIVNELSTCYVEIPKPMREDMGCSMKNWLEVKTEVGTVGGEKIAKIGVGNLLGLIKFKDHPGFFNSDKSLVSFEGSVQSVTGPPVDYWAREERAEPGYKFYFKGMGKWVKTRQFCEHVLNPKTDREIIIYPEEETGESFNYYRGLYKVANCQVVHHSLKTHNYLPSFEQ